MAKFYFGCTILYIYQIGGQYMIYFTCYTETWWIAHGIIIIFHLTHQISLMIVACNTFQCWVARQAPWQMIIANHTHYTQMFNCANGILKSTFWLLGSPEILFISKAKKKVQVSNCDVTLEVWTQKEQLTDGKSVQRASKNRTFILLFTPSYTCCLKVERKCVISQQSWYVPLACFFKSLVPSHYSSRIWQDIVWHINSFSKYAMSQQT